MIRLMVIAFMLIFVQCIFAQTENIVGFYNKNSAGELNLEKAFDKNLSREDIGETIKLLSGKPHHLGSPGDKEYADYVLKEFRKWGWDANIETFYVLFPTPKVRELEMISPISYKAVLKEPALKEDPSSGQEGQLPTYNSYSADGDVTAELVFVNYGLPEDYEVLNKMGIDVKGKIVISKYGGSWRGIKPKVAQEHGAIGCLIYSDPADDGYSQGDVYPKGPFRNEYGVQRGSVVDMSVYPGDPLTPGIGATKDATRLERNQAPSLLKIPVLPISYHDAAPLLRAIEGPAAPAGWHGGLPFAYHIGPGKAKVHLKVAFNWDIVPCNDVIAKIAGSEFPDEWVIRGNHMDAWVNGAGDPVSGLASMLDEAKSLGIMMKNGWKPKRTIVYCAWDGEEPGLLGSTEWVEEHGKELKEKAVIYINSDGNGRGFLYVDGEQALEPFMDQIARQVIDPQTGVSVFERRRSHEAISGSGTEARKKSWNEKEVKLYALGSGSDFSSFIQHTGIPALNMGYGGEDPGGEYHSIYDSYSLYIKFKDPGFRYGVTLAETAGHAVLRMAGADIMPFDYTHLVRTIDDYTKDLISLLESTRETTDFNNLLISSGSYAVGEDPLKGYILPVAKSPVPFLDFSPLQNSVEQLKISMDSLNSIYLKYLNSASAGEAFNRALYLAGRQLLIEAGLPRRPWYKHILYAPGFYTGYAVKTMPGIREAIEQRNWTEAQEQIEVTAKSIITLAKYFNTIAGIGN